MGVSGFVVSCPLIGMRGNVLVLSFLLLIVFVSVHRLVAQSWVDLSFGKMYMTWHRSVAG